MDKALVTGNQGNYQGSLLYRVAVPVFRIVLRFLMLWLDGRNG
ncbi:MAG: hypothetical protein RMY33_014760 [Nostoc sp. DedQUE03]|nr:hypothetical protein [Nostoc sp. DedQUE02]